MDYSEALIKIQQAKDKAAQACRERKWEDALEFAGMLQDAWAEFTGAIAKESLK